MANTKNVQDISLRKSLKRAQRRRLKAVIGSLSTATRDKLRRVRKEKMVGLRAFLAKEAK
ncbi:MAG: hypothetical protein ACOYOB_06550 [Myxococcota bacterium]|jgi:hypothetical protein